MKARIAETSVAAGLVFALLVGCEQARPTAPVKVQTLAVNSAQGADSKKLDVSLCSPGRGGFTIVSSNPWFPMDVGRQLVLTGEEDGETIVFQLTVLDRTRVIAGVTTRVIEEREFVNGALAEVSWNYHVQASDGTICYYGEDVDAYENGGVSHEGAWCAATPGNQAGIFMPANPQPGMKYQNEIAPGVAEDEAQIVGFGPRVVPFGRFTETIRIREHDPLDGGTEFKVHAFSTGIIVDGTLELVDINSTSGAPPLPSITTQFCGT